MEKEVNVKKSLIEKFGILEEKFVIPRERRIFVEVPQDDFMNVCRFAAGELGFDSLCTITGLDIGENYQFIYHLADKNGIVLNLKLNVPKANPVIESVTPIFNGAIFYEKELIDMFGAVVEGLTKEGRRYPLPDWWPEDQHPLRKDWSSKGLCMSKEEVK